MVRPVWFSCCVSRLFTFQWHIHVNWLILWYDNPLVVYLLLSISPRIGGILQRHQICRICFPDLAQISVFWCGTRVCGSRNWISHTTIKSVTISFKFSHDLFDYQTHLQLINSWAHTQALLTCLARQRAHSKPVPFLSLVLFCFLVSLYLKLNLVFLKMEFTIQQRIIMNYIYKSDALLRKKTC